MSSIDSTGCDLQPRQAFAFLPFRSDEEKGESPAEKGKKHEEEDESPQVPDVRIDFDDIAGRVQALPLPRGNYRELAVNDSAVFYLDTEEGDFNRFDYRSVGPRKLYAFDREDREASEIAARVDAYRLSADGSHVMYRSGKSFKIMRASSERGASATCPSCSASAIRASCAAAVPLTERSPM